MRFWRQKFGYDTAEEYAEAKLSDWDQNVEDLVQEKYDQMYRDGEAAVEGEYEKNLVILNHQPIMSQKAKDTQEMIQKRKDEGKPPYTVTNITGVETLQEAII